jgi:magnesium transporter
VADEPVLDQPMTDGPKPNSVVDCAVYVDGRRLPGSHDHAGAIGEVRTRAAGFVWIGLFEPDEQLLQSGQL